MRQDDIMRLFFENPSKEFQIRGIARELKASKTAISYQIKILFKRKLIIRNNKGIFPSFIANNTSEAYRFHKRQYFLERIIESGLLDYIEEQANPKCIILFGSFAKAEYDEKSDIDLFVQSGERTLDLGKFERRLKHKINALFEPDLDRLSPELFNNIINGMKLRGFIKIK